MMITDDSDKKASARLEEILGAFSKNDKDDLKAMFSPKALNEADNLDSNLDYLFGFFHGMVKTWKQTGFTAGGDIENGKKNVQLISWYTVITDKDNYEFFLIDYPVDAINPNNVGLYTLRVIKAADEDTQFTYWQDMNIAGIYKP